MPLRGFYKRRIATPEFVNSQTVETNICNYSPPRPVSTDMRLAPVSCKFYKSATDAVSNRHTKIYIRQFQESIVNVVKQIMVSLGSRKRQGQNIGIYIHICI